MSGTDDYVSDGYQLRTRAFDVLCFPDWKVKKSYKKSPSEGNLLICC